MLDRYNNRKPSTGTLYLTATHLIFVDPDAKKETWVRILSRLEFIFRLDDSSSIESAPADTDI